MIALAMMIAALELHPEPWLIVNDGVMGGVSRSRMVSSGQGLVFEGELSLENNGGFASVRRALEQDLSGADGVRIRVRGDGRTYQARFRQGDAFDGVAWRAEFDTNGDWQTLVLDFSAFEAVFRGRRVAQAGPLIAGEIGQLGFMLADGQPGPFRLEIGAIEFLAGTDPAD